MGNRLNAFAVPLFRKGFPSEADVRAKLAGVVFADGTRPHPCVVDEWAHETAKRDGARAQRERVNKKYSVPNGRQERRGPVTSGVRAAGRQTAPKPPSGLADGLAMAAMMGAALANHFRRPGGRGA